jgi:signal transduction histidine kinase
MMTASNPLQNKKNLSYKIIFSIMLTMSLLVTLLILVFSYSNSLLEQELLEKQNLSELERLKQEFVRDPLYQLPQTAKLRIYQPNRDNTELPLYLQSLPRGYNDELSTEEKTYFVLVSDLNEKPIYIVSDISEFENSEKTFETIIFISWAILLALIFAVSYLLTRYLLKPISDFADEIDRLRPEQRGLKLSGNYQGLEIGKITRSFDRYLNQLDEYVERQRSFAAMASHELRTPLTVVQTSAELISSQTEDELIQSQCEKINRSINNMSNMIIALLSITRDQPQQEKNSDISLFNIVIDALENRHNEIRFNGIKIDNQISSQAAINGNRSLISVVINNLLSNAIKHSPQGIITIRYQGQLLSIEDNGSGLDTEDVEQLFKFGVAGKNNGGYGLGLYIARLICDKQGWKLALKKADPGTIANVTFSQSHVTAS